MRFPSPKWGVDPTTFFSFASTHFHIEIARQVYHVVVENCQQKSALSVWRKHIRTSGQCRYTVWDHQWVPSWQTPSQQLEIKNKLPIFYKQFVDDTLRAMLDPEAASEFLETLNKSHPSINFKLVLQEKWQASFSQNGCYQEWLPPRYSLPCVVNHSQIHWNKCLWGFTNPSGWIKTSPSQNHVALQGPEICKHSTLTAG